MRSDPPTATDLLVASLARTPAAQRLRRRVERGGVLSWPGLPESAQAFTAALLRHWFSTRPVVVVTEGLKAQERLYQDLLTWLAPLGPPAAPSAPAARSTRCLFYPAWETLPHEARLPHADVISERLETLAALGASPELSPHPGPAPVIVTAVVALLQRTFNAATLRARLRHLRR